MTKLWYLADYFERKLNWSSENLTERLNKGAEETSTGAYKSVQKSIRICTKVYKFLITRTFLRDFLYLFYFFSTFAITGNHIN